MMDDRASRVADGFGFVGAHPSEIPNELSKSRHAGRYQLAEVVRAMNASLDAVQRAYDAVPSPSSAQSQWREGYLSGWANATARVAIVAFDVSASMIAPADDSSR